MKNREKSIAFEYAYQPRMAIVKQETLHGLPSQEIINDQIRTIIPLKPSVDNIQVDLVGRRFADKPDGHFCDRTFVIKDDEVENFEIRSTADEKDRYKIKAMVTRERVGGVAFLVDLDILYVLGLPMTIDGISANFINIVRENTELYRQCIKVETCWTGYSVNIVNYSDALLLIAGIRYDSGSWTRFSIEVAGNDCYQMYCRDCELHFIERR